MVFVFPVYFPYPFPYPWDMGKYGKLKNMVYNIKMGYRKVPLISGEYYHIYNRGNSKQAIFLDDKDRDRFVKLLYFSNSKKFRSFRENIIDKKLDVWDFDREEKLVSIGAWVLMPNHFHIYLISPKSSGIPGVGEAEETLELGNDKNITFFMNRLCTSYVKYFNTKYKRSGVLFEGPFKSRHVNNDNYAKYLFSYIHLNPLKLVEPKWKELILDDTKIFLNYLDTYKWSSYLDHKGIYRKESKILNLEDFPDYFSDISDFNLEIISWLSLDPEILPISQG